MCRIAFPSAKKVFNTNWKKAAIRQFKTVFPSLKKEFRTPYNRQARSAFKIRLIMGLMSAQSLSNLLSISLLINLFKDIRQLMLLINLYKEVCSTSKIKACNMPKAWRQSPQAWKIKASKKISPPLVKILCANPKCWAFQIRNRQLKGWMKGFKTHRYKK